MIYRIEPRIVELIPLTQIDTESQLRVREIRNEDSMRKVMYTDHIIDVNKHLNWINRLKRDNKQIVFAIIDKSGPLGIVSVNAVGYQRKAGQPVNSVS